MLAGAVGAVEREDARSQFRQTHAAIRTGELLAEGSDLPVLRLDVDQASREGGGGLHRIRQAAAAAFLDHKPVHNDLYVMFLLLVQLDILIELVHCAIDLGAGEAVAAHSFQKVPVLPLAAAHQRRVHHEAGPFGHIQYLVYDLLLRLGGDKPAAFGAVGLADAGIKQPQVVVDLRDGAHGRPGILADGPLVYGDSGGKPLDAVHIRLLHLTEKLTGIDGQRLHIAALALGIDGVECE